MWEAIKIIIVFSIGYAIGEYREYKRLAHRDKFGVLTIKALLFNDKETIMGVLKEYIGERYKTALDNTIIETLKNKLNKLTK